MVNNVYLSKSNIHGYGVFANKNIKKGTIIESCHYLVVGSAEVSNESILQDYMFENPQDQNESFVVLGLAMIYNHSIKPNAEWDISKNGEFVEMIALQDIKKNDEILHNYGEGWWDEDEFDEHLNSWDYLYAQK